ncbi:MAG: hypothetical protein ACK559_34665, partial [bacterium]
KKSVKWEYLPDAVSATLSGSVYDRRTYQALSQNQPRGQDKVLFVFTYTLGVHDRSQYRF